MKSNKVTVGMVFDRWTVLAPATPTKCRSLRWLCRCVCGVERPVMQSLLLSKRSRSCGCRKLEGITRKHNMTYTSEYHTWRSAKGRCFNKKNKQYPDWGGRGITMCEEWKHDFMAFFKHIGPRPSPKHSLDRKDNDGNYEPGNVRWVTRIVSLRNRRPYRPRKGKAA